MGEPNLGREFASEAALATYAGALARRWRELGLAPAIVALQGDLGAGKTTWVRAVLRGLGYAGRVPSPTYTLLEHYALDGLTVVHLDLYRLAHSDEFDYLGARDWLAETGVWMFVEWPERVPQLLDRADLVLELKITGPMGRRIEFRALSGVGTRLLEAKREIDSSN